MKWCSVSQIWSKPSSSVHSICSSSRWTTSSWLSPGAAWKKKNVPKRMERRSYTDTRHSGYAGGPTRTSSWLRGGIRARRGRDRGGRSMPVFLGDDHRSGRIKDVVGRHDLDAVLVERVLDVGVQGAQHRGASELVANSHAQGVLGIEIRQGHLQDFRRGFFLHFRRVGGGLQQKGVDLTPRSTISDGHGRLEDGRRRRRGTREVLRDGREDHGVRYADLLIGGGADLGGKQPDTYHRALDLAHVDALAGAER